MTIEYINPHRKLNYHLDRIAGLQAGEKPPPVNVEIDLSNRCSRGCHFCHFAYTHTRGPLAAGNQGAGLAGDLMETDLALRVVGELAAYGVRSITWTGGGEPTLHPDFDAVVEAAEIDQGLYTHGGHIDPERAGLLKRACRWVYVSLDYSNSADYARYKGVPESAYFDSLQGLKRLVRARGTATVGVGFLVNRENQRDLWAMTEVGLALGVDYVQLRPTIHFHAAEPGRVAEATDWMDEDFFERLAAMSLRERVIVDLARFKMYKGWAGHPYPACYWSGLQSVITPDGRVWACVNKRGFPEAALGDLHQQPFAEIWETAPIQAVNDRCRAMCRGHLPNLDLAPMLAGGGVHKNFI